MLFVVLFGNFAEAQNVQALALPDIWVESVSTADSKSLSVNYFVSSANVTTPLTFGFFRSATPNYDPNNSPLP